MKILLVSLVKDYLRAEKSGKPKGTIFLRFPSLALANLAALTPEEDEIKICDEQISPIDYNLDVDLVAISVNTSISKRAYDIADKFRKKGVKVIFGGFHPSFMPEESLKHADAVVIGDANGSWEQLLKDFKKGKLKKKYFSNQKNSLKIPTPKWEIFKGMGYISTNFIEVTRGCSHNCKFCSSASFYHSLHRMRPIAEVVRDIKQVQSFPKKFIFFVDDNLVCNKEYAKELFKALAPLNIYWISQSTVDIAEDEELVKLAAESGCFGLFLGFDSISKDSVKESYKGHNKVLKYKKAVEMLHKYGIGVEAGFMFGFDHDKKEVFAETLKFLDETKIESFLAMYVTPVPGTPGYNESKKQKKLLTNDFSKYDFRQVVIKPKQMSSKELYDGVSWLSKEFNSRKRMAKRISWKFWQFIKRPSMRSLLGVVGNLGINLAFRKRIMDLSLDGTFPKEYGKI